MCSRSETYIFCYGSIQYKLIDLRRIDMARIRTVKPELFKHVGLFETEMAFQLPIRLAFIALFTCCDRMGRFRWDPKRLKLDVLPYDEIDVSRVLDALAMCGFIVKYEHQGECFGCIPTWASHQQINNREIASILPSVEVSTILEIKNISENNKLKVNETYNDDAGLTCESRVEQPTRTCTRGIWNRERGIGNMEGKNTIVASEMRPSVFEDPIRHVFQHWKTVMSHAGAKLDHKRKSMISKALKSGYSYEQLCDAITGCSYTPHNMGDNDRGQRYDGLHVILRDGDQIDRFIHNYQYPPRPITDVERRSQANMHTLQGWMDKKLAEGRSHGNS